MYHPDDPSASEVAAGFNDSEEFEFIELHNISTDRTLDLTGVQFTNGIEFDFTGSSASTLAPGGYVVVVTNPAAFAARYNAPGVAIAGTYSGRLNNAGERIVLSHNLVTTLHDFSYDDEWYPETDGEGPSLVVVDANAPKSQWAVAEGWKSGTQNGSPGGPDTPAGMLGDLTGDNLVGLADLAILQAHLGTATGALASQGDLNGDSAINRADAAILAGLFGQGSGAGSPAASAAAAVVRRAAGARVDALAAQPSPLAARSASRRAAANRNDASTINAAAVDASLHASRADDPLSARSLRTSRVMRRT
jgi:hypothetical protein